MTRELNGSPHHASDRMVCSVCGVVWPCEAWLLARGKADRAGNRQTLIEVAVPVRVERGVRP